jgi:hypothetical protein
MSRRQADAFNGEQVMIDPGEAAPSESRITHKVDFSVHRVTQRGGSVVAVRVGELEPQEVSVPPTEWGNSWAWNVLEDGSGIYFRRT